MALDRIRYSTLWIGTPRRRDITPTVGTEVGDDAGMGQSPALDTYAMQHAPHRVGRTGEGDWSCDQEETHSFQGGFEAEGGHTGSRVVTESVMTTPGHSLGRALWTLHPGARLADLLSMQFDDGERLL